MEVVAGLEVLRAHAAEFEGVAHEVEEKQSQSLTRKKQLAEDTKNFKRLGEADKLAGLPDLLKGYQSEIDQLSKRSKFAEAAFETLIKILNAAPDPRALRTQLGAIPDMAAAASAAERQRADVLEADGKQKDKQIAKITEALRDLEAELLTVTNQAATVRALQKQVREYEAGAEGHLEEARRQRDEEWTKRVEDVRHEFGIQREQHLEALDQLRQQRDARDSELDRMRAGRLEEQQLAEEAIHGRGLELEALSADLERAQAELEQERQRAEHKEPQGSTKMLQSLLDSSQQRSASLERELAELRKRLVASEDGGSRNEEIRKGELEELRAAVATRDEEAQCLREQLDLRPSFEQVTDLQRRLQNVETVEFADVSAAATDLEGRLLRHQRVLEGQLSEARVRIQGLESETADLKRQLQSTEDQRKDLSGLVSRLETDLGETSRARGAPVAEAPPLASLLPALPEGSVSTCAAGEADAIASGAAMPSMLDIVTGQRDRLRERVGDLEQDRDRLRATMDQEKKRGETLKADNVKLLERARYLQSYQPKQGAKPGSGQKRGGRGDDLEGRYGAAYEEGLGPVGPFEQFREDEKARRVANMNAGERFLVTTGTLLFASKPCRMFTLIYATTLHVLVFVVIERLAFAHATDF